MIQNRQTCGKYRVFTLDMNIGEKLEFKVKEPNTHLKSNQLLSCNLWLEGECSQKIVGAIMVNGQVTPHVKTNVVNALDRFDSFRQNHTWVSEAEVTMTAVTKSIYLCVSIEPNGTAPVVFDVKDISLAEIPVGALFIPTVDCGEYLKNQLYVNETSGLTLPVQDGKVIIIEEVEQ